MDTSHLSDTQTVQNIYDDPEFFAGYKHLRDTRSGLNEVLEQPAIRTLLPEMDGLAVLEIGCGMGQFARFCAEQGARRVVGVEVSERMLEVAQRENAHERIVYLRAPMESVVLPETAFDLAVSSLALHYVEDYAAMVKRVHLWLKPGGMFVFSVEHPIVTAQIGGQGWVRDENRRKLYWPVDNYGTEGKREQHWIIEGVVKYHRRVSTLLNGLTDAGFLVERVEEPEALSEALRERPTLQEESRRPPFLVIRARSGPKHL